MMNEKNKKIAVLILIIAIIGIVIYQQGGVPFLGALVMFEGGNEMVFKGEETVITKIFNETTQMNETEIIPAVNDIEKSITMKSDYITDAILRIVGTSTITGSYIDVEYTEEFINNTGGTELILTTENLWTQGENFTDITEIDLMPVLENQKEDDVVKFKFHSDSPGSIIVASLNIDWGPTNAQIEKCLDTNGTFDNVTLICDCADEDYLGFTWDEGCLYNVTGYEGDGDGDGDGDGSGPGGTPQPPTEDFDGITIPGIGELSTFKIVILVLIIGGIIYYKGFEQGPNRGLIRKKKK